MILRTVSATLAAFWVAGSALAACPDANDGHADFYPTAERLPENLLRIYVYFPRAMGQQEGVETVQLLDDKGDPLPGVFLANRSDLWSPDRHRLTMLLDPGRVKTGLIANAELGRALVPGRMYAFEVSGTALDADGCPLGTNTRHEFMVTAADLDPPDPARWTLKAPAAKTTEPLIVSLGSAHDHLSLAFRLRVHDAKGRSLAGAISLGPGEETWQFTPLNPWSATPYYLVIDETLEDLAGNRPGQLFDRPIAQEPVPWTQKLQFTPHS